MWVWLLVMYWFGHIHTLFALYLIMSRKYWKIKNIVLHELYIKIDVFIPISHHGWYIICRESVYFLHLTFHLQAKKHFIRLGEKFYTHQTGILVTCRTYERLKSVGIMGAKLRYLPSPFSIILQWCTRSFKGALTWAPVPMNATLSAGRSLHNENFTLNGIWSWWQFSFRFWTKWNNICFRKSNGKLSPRSYPIQFERKWKYSFLGVEIPEGRWLDGIDRIIPDLIFSFSLLLLFSLWLLLL